MNGGVKSNVAGGSFGLQDLSLASIKASQQSVHLTLGILRQPQAVFYALSFFQLDGFAAPAPAQVTQTVGRWHSKQLDKFHKHALSQERNLAQAFIYKT